MGISLDWSMNNNFEIKTTRLHFVSIHEFGLGSKKCEWKYQLKNCTDTQAIHFQTKKLIRKGWLRSKWV